MMTVRGSLCAFALAASAACPLHASTWTVSFDPANPVNTNGWDFGATTTNGMKSATQPGGRKFDPKRGETVSIESPIYAANVRAVALSAWGSSLNATSRVEVWGRADAASAYASLFSRTNLSNRLLENEPNDRFAVPDGVVCRQLKIGYTKSGGTWTLAKVSVTDDAIRAETPTNLRTDVADAAARRVRVSWDLATGLSDSEWRTFTTASAGGLGESETLWRETFDGVPSTSVTRLLDTAALAGLGFGAWDAVNVRQVKGLSGALQLGTDKSVSGSLATPPPGRDFAAGHVLVVRAAARDVASGVMPVFVVAGGVTSCVAEVAIAKAPQDVQIAMPALAAADRILLHSITNVASRATLIHDLAICAPDAYRTEYVVTNACSDVTSVAGNSAELTAPADGTNLWIEVRSAYGGETSAWTDPFPVTLAGSGAADEGEAADTADEDEGGGDLSPSRIRAGRLPDGRVRVAWAVPDGATNVKMRVWTLSRTSGGLAAVAADDVLWRETFAAAPATNSKYNVSIDSEAKFDLYADKGAAGWDPVRSVSVALATEAGVLKIGTGEKTGALVSKGLSVSGDGLTLVVTAKHYGKNPNVILRTATLWPDDSAAAGVSEAVTTNELGQTRLGAAFAEYPFPVGTPSGEVVSFLVETVRGTSSDCRIVIDDIALVRNYVAAAVVTNEALSADCGTTETLDLPADGAVRYVSLAAQGADGVDGDWTAPLVLDPSALDDWTDRAVTMKAEDVVVSLVPDALPLTADKKERDLADSPFRFFVDGEERFELAHRDATKQLQKGVYVCTNVFERDWVALVPGASGDVRDAECRLTVLTDGFAVRRIELSGTFAQLNAANREEKVLLLQYRAIAPDGAAGDWMTSGEYKSTYTTADASPDLAGTQTNVAYVADVRLARSATVEARVWCCKENDSGREAPLGFRDFRVRVIGAGQSLVFVIR